MATNSAHESPERNDLLLVDYILQVGRRSVEWHLLDSLSSLPGVLCWKTRSDMILERFAVQNGL